MSQHAAALYAEHTASAGDGTAGTPAPGRTQFAHTPCRLPTRRAPNSHVVSNRRNAHPRNTRTTNRERNRTLPSPSPSPSPRSGPSMPPCTSKIATQVPRRYAQRRRGTNAHDNSQRMRAREHIRAGGVSYPSTTAPFPSPSSANFNLSPRPPPSTPFRLPHHHRPLCLQRPITCFTSEVRITPALEIMGISILMPAENAGSSAAEGRAREISVRFGDSGAAQMRARRWVLTVVLEPKGTKKTLPTEPCVLRTFGHDRKLDTCAQSVPKKFRDRSCPQMKTSEKSTPPNVRNTHSSATNTILHTIYTIQGTLCERHDGLRR
eukprot:COSAG02_NODE_4032_length_5881_cov_10.701712_6_plen_321_part_00